MRAAGDEAWTFCTTCSGRPLQGTLAVVACTREPEQGRALLHRFPADMDNLLSRAPGAVPALPRSLVIISPIASAPLCRLA